LGPRARTARTAPATATRATVTMMIVRFFI
jgi:hypothetical protein